MTLIATHPIAETLAWVSFGGVALLFLLLSFCKFPQT